MAGSTTTDDLTQELQATLNARRDLGAAYDDHFVESFMEKLKTQVVGELRADVLKSVPAARAKKERTVESRLRTSLISSALILGLFFVAVFGLANQWSYGFGHITYTLQAACFILSCLIVAYNLFINLRLRVK